MLKKVFYLILSGSRFDRHTYVFDYYPDEKEIVATLEKHSDSVSARVEERFERVATQD